MEVTMKSIGTVHTDAPSVPNFWTISDVEGTLVIDEPYRHGLKGIEPGSRIVVIFHFHRSRPFTPRDLTQHPRGDLSREKRGVFDINSPIRPNPIGMSILTVTGINDTTISVKGLDMIDGTPVLDIKPFRT
jgi:tRNA-Thr(GGU) m(6)t(6)A37 methyltransferase TsaA